MKHLVSNRDSLIHPCTGLLWYTQPRKKKQNEKGTAKPNIMYREFLVSVHGKHIYTYYIHIYEVGLG